MDATRRISTLRRVATTASLAALLLLPAGQAEAKAKKHKPKSPVITKVTPMVAKVGGTLTLKGRHFKKGENKNSVGFKATGASVVFVRSDLSTEKTMTVKIPPRLEKVMDGPTKFKLRVLSRRFGKGYTSTRMSPVIQPRDVVPGDGTPGPGGETPEEKCNATGSGDLDGDLLPNDYEANTIGTDACHADSDGDGISDGYELRSALDLNDDEYQQPNRTLPAPTTRAYPNPLQADETVDYDGDGLSLQQEFNLWQTLTPLTQRTFLDPVADSNGTVAATPLNYSDGLQYSVSRRCGAAEDALCGTGGTHTNRRVPDLPADSYPKWSDFLAWAAANGYANVYLHDSGDWFEHQEGRFEYSILDVNRANGVEAGEQFALDRDGDGYLSDDERDEDADGLSNLTESRIEMRPEYWASCYDKEPAFPRAYDNTDPAKADTDGDGVRDGADDEDNDDVPNMMELSRKAASGFLDTEDGQDGVTTHAGGFGPTCKPDADLLVKVGEEQNGDGSAPPTEAEQAAPYVENHPTAYGQVNPFNPCLPDPNSRSCPRFFEDGVELPAPLGGPHWWSLQ